MNQTMTGAVFSECHRFRYLLSRQWDASKRMLAYCGLNPSTASADIEDRTSLKFRGFAERLGYGGYVTGNLYAWISTDPKGLRTAGYPVGPENDEHLARIFGGRDVICAWGSNAAKLSRPREVMALLRRVKANTMALRINDDGTPAHPLYLPYTLAPIPFAAHLRARAGTAG